mmetsp:Transcript_18440/g.27858  ORF Transcript_18440/g.27858 Transcript_18440/m.27858 type:complete len:512 (+) Transcript_18440:133-1668(+)|eukprot:CAMPEP_0178924588 /NCGR_PEP_ID=MMETSP0786-20121207/17416_1 /TAXON_ID=186022 /ORGANISM="Thalassionema frauenfeldii, Strain CCMP 1798" /LENGTH=511 /DNA_ID=CAMNT_0020599327 /DNA_START=55 /DNA_END=1590 /DNA_ORIENTATION=+
MSSRQPNGTVYASSRGLQENTTETTSAITGGNNKMQVISVLKEGITKQYRNAYTMSLLFLSLFYSTFLSFFFGVRPHQEGEDNKRNDHSLEDEISRDAIETILTRQKAKEEQRFVVSLYHNKDDIVIQAFLIKEDAEALYNEHKFSSRVIMSHYFDGIGTQHKLIRCCTASWDLQGLGVATLLYRDKHDNAVDSSKQEFNTVQKLIDQGLLPFVPPQRDEKVQKRLKAAMRIAFKRKTVAYFGSAPLHFRSLSYFPSSSTSPRFASIKQKTHENPISPLPSKHQKYVTLTIDDAPCRFSDATSSEIPKILALLKKYNVKATFMVVGSWCRNHEDNLIRLIQDGHELANHCMMDRSYEYEDPDDFGKAVDECSEIIQNLYERAGVTERDRCPSWAFRAPHGRYTQEMSDQLFSRGMINVMCDTYASCPVVEDGDFIGKHLTNTCKDGSIILLHMPEVHVRQWCLTALEILLEGLKHRNMQVVPLGEMARLHSFRPEDGLASMFPTNNPGCLP